MSSVNALINKEWKDVEDNVIVSRIGMDYLLFTSESHFYLIFRIESQGTCCKNMDFLKIAENFNPDEQDIAALVLNGHLRSLESSKLSSGLLFMQ